MDRQRCWFLGFMILTLVGLLCFPTYVVKAEKSSVYDLVLDKLEHLTPDNSIVVEMGVEEDHYYESFKITDQALGNIQGEGIPKSVIEKLEGLKDKEFVSQEGFTTALEQTLGEDIVSQYEFLLLNAFYDGRAVYDYGDQFELRFRSSKETYVVLMHLSEIREDKALEKGFSGGEITFLLPNENFSETKIEAGEVYSSTEHFDLGIIAGEPPALETVNLLCSVERLDWIPENLGGVGFYVITPDDEERLQGLLDKLEKLEQAEWSGSSIKIQIGPRESFAFIGGAQRGLPKKFGALPPIGATGTSGKFFPPLKTTGSTGKQ